jgi:hypothetical protein
MNKQIDTTNEMTADTANIDSVWTLLDAEVVMIGGGEIGVVMI